MNFATRNFRFDMDYGGVGVMVLYYIYLLYSAICPMALKSSIRRQIDLNTHAAARHTVASFFPL